MEHDDKFSLVPRPPSALEKADCGAKRILEGMVSETLAIANNKAPEKRIFRILTCSGESAIRDTVKVIVSGHLGNRYAVEIIDSPNATEILELAEQRSFDLIVPLVNNILVSNRVGKDRVFKALELLARVKAQYGIPVLVLCAGGLKGLTDWAGLEDEANRTGLDTFLWTPFDVADFRMALETCLKISTLGNTAARPERAGPARIVVVDDEEWFLEMVRVAILAKFKDVSLQVFQDSEKAWNELSGTDPDFLIVGGVMPGLSGEEIVGRLEKKNAKYPILVVSGWPLTELWVKKYADKNSNISFLRKPFTMEQLYGELSKHLGQSDNPE